MITLDGLPLTNPGKWRLSSGTRLKTYPGRVSAGSESPGRDGVSPSIGSSFEPGTVRLAFILTGATRTEMESNCELLFGVIGQRHKLLDLVDVDRGRVAQIEVLSSSEPDRRGAFFWRLTVVASVPAVFWRDLSTTDSTTNVTASAATTALTGLAGSTGSINDALIQIRGGFSAVTLTDPVSGDRLTINQAVSSAQYLVIDTANWIARLHSAESWSTAAGSNAILNVVSNRGSGPMITLNPDFSTGAGRVRLTVQGTNPGPPPMLTVRAKRSFL